MTRQIISYIKTSHHFISITVLLLFLVTNIYSYRTIQIYEDSSYGPLYPIDTVTFQDSSISIIRLANRCTQVRNQDPQRVLPLRVLYPDGTLNASDISFWFSDYNFCPLNRLSIFALPDDTLLISYLKEMQFNQVKFMGIITTLDGQIINSEVELSDIVNLEINSTISYPSDITTKSDGLLFTITYDKLNITWRLFEWDHNGKSLNAKSWGVFSPAMPSGQYEIDSFQTFGTLDGGYGLAYSISPVNSQITSTSHSLVYATFLHDQATWTPPTIIYEAPFGDVTIIIKSCTPSIDPSSEGFTCFINGRNVINGRNGQLQTQYFWKMLNFLSMGSIQSYRDLPSNEIKFETTRNFAINYTDVLPLHNGGFCMFGIRLDGGGNIQGSLYNITEMEGVVKGIDWGMPAISGMKYDVLNNDTIWTAAPGEDNSGTFWYIVSNNINNSNLESGYKNKQILSTTPSLNETIPRNISKITITYKKPIVLSAGYVAIYQRIYNTDDTTPAYTDLLRQTFPASSSQFVNVTNNTQVEVIILSSTFNQFNSSYYIQIGDNFVRNKDFNEPLRGIESGIWMIKTIGPENQNFTDDKKVLLRLDVLGSILFQNMSSSQRSLFFNNLVLSFSQAIPVPSYRLRTSKRFQYDGSKDSLPILIDIQLNASRNKEDMNTEQILDYMNTLVKNKLFTRLNDLENVTSLLDSDFGAVEIVGPWMEYRYQIAVIICAIFILCVLVFLAHNANPKGNSMSLFKFVLVFVDFIMDVIFLFYNGRDVPNLYTPSIVILLAPLSVNFFITMFIFLKEYHGNSRFSNFARDNALATTMLLVIGYIDLVSLELLTSRLANIHLLSAPFDHLTNLCVYFGSLAILLCEDIPQLIIQIIYLKSVIIYKFVPLLTLITCSLIILTNVIGRLYDCYRNLRHRYSSSSPNDSDDEQNQIGYNFHNSYYNDNSNRDYLIGAQSAEQIFNRWWEIGSGKTSDFGKEEGKNEREKGKGKEGDVTEGSGVGDAEYNNEPSIIFGGNDNQPVIAGPSGYTSRDDGT